MKFKNKMMVICLVLFVLISISAVSAADDNAESIKTVSNDNISLTANDYDNDEILSADEGSFGDLETRIKGGSSNIVLDKDYAYSSTDSIKTGIVINQNDTIIDGQGHVIDAKGKSRIFDVTATTVTLKNIIFKNGFADNGGAVYGYGDNLRVYNCTFINNNATAWGGAVYSYPNSLAVFLNSTFIDNNAKYGGALTTVYGYKQYVINSTFIGNNATYGGAILVYGKHDTIERPYSDEVIISGCKFINNVAPEGNAISDHYYSSATINIDHSIFLANDNSSFIDSGAYFIHANYNWFGNTYENRTKMPNVDETVNLTNWLYLDVIPDITNSIATVSINNLYDSQTGQTSVYSTSKLPAINVDVSAKGMQLDVDEVSLGHSGKNTFDIHLVGDCEITATYEGSSLTKKIKAGSFSELQSLINDAADGSTLKLEKDYVYVTDVDSKYGIIIRDKHNLVIDGNGHNINGLNGASIFAVEKSSSDITFENMNLVNGYAPAANSQPGSAINTHADYTNIINCTFYNNINYGLTGGGGAVYGYASNGRIANSRFINNTHTYTSAGALYWRGVGLTVSDTLFENNTATSEVDVAGGAVYLNDGGRLTNCTFNYNTADYSGAISGYNYIVDNCTFTGNVALSEDSSRGGGAIYTTNITVINSVFIDNVAKYGGALFVSSQNTVVDKCLFVNSTDDHPVVSSVTGGKISNSIFLNNDLSSYNYIISCIYPNIHVDYNWYGSYWKDYDKYIGQVSNLADMTKWLFLNYTAPVYNNETKEFQTKLNFLVYDSTTNRVIDYDTDDLPAITFTLSGENITLNKNNVLPGEVISGVANYHKGNLVVQYGDVKYLIPLNFRQPSKIIVNSTINVIEGNKTYIDEIIEPFNNWEEIYLLERAGRVTFKSNDTNIVTVNEYGYVTAKKIGVAEIFIKYNGLNNEGEDLYLPSNATVIINVTKIPTYIDQVFPTELEVGDTGNIIFSLYDAVTKRSVSGHQLTFLNDNPEALKIDVLGYDNVKFTALKNGTATITVKFDGNDKYEATTLVFSINIGQKDPKLNITPSILTLDAGKLYGIGIKVKASSTYGKFEYLTNDTGVAILEYQSGMHMVKAIGKGVANITIKFLGDDMYKPAVAYLIVHVNNIPTHIVINDTVSISNTDEYHLNPAVYDENDNPLPQFFEFASNDTSVVTVNEYGVLTGVGLGKANITVNYKGTDKYAPSSASVIVTVSTATNEIRVVSDVEIQVDKSVNLNATLAHGGKLLYVSSNSSVVSVDSKGTITARKLGEATITVRYEGSEKYDLDTETVNVKVVHVPTSIDADKSFAVEIDKTAYVNAALNPSLAGTLTYSIDDESIAKVASNGIVTAVGVGKTTMHINFAGNNKYAPSDVTVEITVYSDYLPTSIEVNDTLDLFVGDETGIGAILNPGNAGKLTYVSSDDKVVTVDTNGKMTAVGEGSANITVSFAGKDKFLPSSANVLVTVSLIPTSIEANDTITVNLTETADIDYVFSNPEAGDLEFIVDDTSIAYVENGKIKGDEVGQTTLIIKFAGNNKYAASNATVKIIVTDVVPTIDVEDSIKVNVTENGVIDAKLGPKDAGKLRFTTKDTSIISVDSNGNVRGLKLGTATVTITFNGNGKYRAVSKNVTVEVVDVETSIDVVDSIELNVTDFKTIDAKLNPGEAGKLIFAADNEFIAVDSNGRIEGLKLGKGTLTITFNGNGKYRAVSKNVTVEVVDVDTNIVLNVSDLTMKYGEETTIKADIRPDAVQPLVFSSSNPDVVTVDEDGNVKAVKPGVANITVSFAGGGKYKASNATVTVTVERAPSSIDIPDHLDLEIGVGILLNPTTTPGKLNLTYTSIDVNTVEVDENGMIFAATAGTAVVTVNFAGNEYYLPSNASVTVDIDKRDTMVKVENDVSIGYSESMNLGAKLVSKNTDVSLTGKLHYVSSDEDVVSVDENGRITANKIGNATITITYDGEKSNKPCNATVNVEVTTKTTSIKLSESSKSLKVDDTYAIVASLVGGPDDYMLIYATEDSDIVRVNPFTGEVTAIGDGTAKITVKYAGDNEYHSSEAEFTVSVSRYVTHITASNTYDMVVYDTIDLHAMVVENEELPLSYSSSEEDVVIVNTKGEATALKSGDAVITISFAGNSKYQPSQKQVIVNVARIPTSINVDDKIELYSGDEYTLTDILTPGDAPTRLLSFESDNWDIFDVDSNGVITAGYEGVAELFISYTGNGVYMPSNKTVIVTVVKKVISENDYNFTVEVDHDAGEATITATLPEDAEGMFQVIINGEAFAEPIVDGKAVITVDELTPGDYSATLRYTGDEKYASINNATKFRIGKYKIDKNKDQAIYVDGTLKYSVHLTLDTQAIEGKTIKFKVNGKTYYAKTDVQGYATIKVKLPAKIKTYTVTAQFGSIKVSNKVKVHVIVAKNLNYKKSSKHTLKVTLKKLNKKYLSNKKVTLKFNGKTYTAKTNKKGVASFALKKSVFSKLKVGKTYKYTVKYSTDTVTKTIKIFK